MDAFISFLINGFSHWSGWEIFLFTILMTHITIASITIFLHRCQAHRALELHAIPSHFFRFWLWLTTATITKEWKAVHLKHHAKCETEDDPHSPQTRGILTVLLKGAWLYRLEAKNPETIAKYGYGTPDDWMERNLYTPYPNLGIIIMLIVDIMLFGMIGVIVWAIQMLWQPIMAAGIINGLGHYWGYRNFESPDHSTNIIPWGILIGGEELHNNHHGYASSAKLSSKWYEFDIGWLYIRILETLGLAKVKTERLIPKITKVKFNPEVTEKTLLTVIKICPLVLNEYKKMIQKIASSKENPEFIKLQITFDELKECWERTDLTKEQLIVLLENWFKKAEESKQEFFVKLSIYLRSIQVST